MQQGQRQCAVSTKKRPVLLLKSGPLIGGISIWTDNSAISSRISHYILSIITCPKPEQLTCVEPSIKRAKS